MAIVICKLDLKPLIIENGGTSPIIGVPNMEVAVEIPSDPKVEKAMKENPLLQQQMVDACKKMFKKTAQMMAKLVKEYEGLAQKGMKVQDMWRSSCEGYRKTLGESCTEACQKVWKDLMQTKAEYKSYKIVTGVKLGLNALSVASGVVTTGLTGWTGIGTVVGVVGVLRGLSTIGQKLYELSKEAEQVQEELEKTIDTVTQFYQTKGPKTTGAIEVLQSAWAEVTTVALPSISKCDEKLKTFKSKLDGVEVNAHQFAKGLNTTLTGADKSKKSLDEWQNLAAAIKFAGGQESAIKAAVAQSEKLEKTLIKAETAANDLIAKTIATVERVKKGRKAWDLDNEMVQELLKKVPTWSKYGQKAAKLVNLAFASDLKDVAQTLGEIAADLTVDSETFGKLTEKIG